MSLVVCKSEMFMSAGPHRARPWRNMAVCLIRWDKAVQMIEFKRGNKYTEMKEESFSIWGITMFSLPFPSHVAFTFFFFSLFFWWKENDNFMSSHQEILRMLKKNIHIQLFNFRSHNQNWGFVRKMGAWLHFSQRETPALRFRPLKIKTKQKSYSGAQDVWLVVWYESMGSKLNTADQIYTDN